MESIRKRIKEVFTPKKRLTEAEKEALPEEYEFNEKTGRYNLITKKEKSPKIKKAKSLTKDKGEDEDEGDRFKTPIKSDNTTKVLLPDVEKIPNPNVTPTIDLKNVTTDKLYTPSQQFGFTNLDTKLKQLNQAEVEENIENMSEIKEAHQEETPIFVDREKFKEAFPSSLQNKLPEELTPIKNDEELENDIKKNTFNTETGTSSDEKIKKISTTITDPDSGPPTIPYIPEFQDAANRFVEENPDEFMTFRDHMVKYPSDINFYNNFIQKFPDSDPFLRQYLKTSGEIVKSDLSTQLPFAVDAVSQEHPVKYHKNSILFYFGSIEKPEFDLELEKNVFDAKMTKDEIIMNSDAIIKNYGSVLFVYSRKSDTRDEFHELIQLQFCFERNLARGSRTKSALVPISELVGFSNALSGNSLAEEKVNDSSELNDGFDEAINNLNNPVDNVIVQKAEPPQPLVAEQQVQVSVNEAFNNVIQAYRNKKMDDKGRPIFNQSLIDSTKIINFNYRGSQSQIDPSEEYQSRYKARIVKF